MTRDELQRLIDVIVSEMAATAAPQARCACHSVVDDCCPDRLRGVLESGELRLVERDIEAITGPCRACGALSKVIIEAALLTDDEKVTACTLAKAAGADYVKTSTGFASGGATAADVALMRRVVGADMGVKAAGGVRDLEGMKAMIAAGATRVGASAGVKIVQQARGEQPSAAR